MIISDIGATLITRRGERHFTYAFTDVKGKGFEGTLQGHTALAGLALFDAIISSTITLH